VKRFRGGLVLKAHILLYYSTLGLGVIKKKKVGETPHTIAPSEEEDVWKKENTLKW